MFQGLVASYNKGMGGVDLADMLMELYKVNHRSRKWYIRIFNWCLGTSVTNAWMIYTKHLRLLQSNKKHILLMQLQLEIANALLQYTSSSADSIQRKRGRPSNAENNKPTSSVGISPSTSVTSQSTKKYRFQSNPPDTKRYDKEDHWVV